ncbi:proline-rich protein 19 [Rhynchocyon petersi]
MDPHRSAPKPFQRPEKPGRVRRRKTRRERNEALVGSHWSRIHQNLPVASGKPGVSRRKSPVALQKPMDLPAPNKLVVITQGRLSREHWGLFSHEVKSLDVGRLLSSRALEPETPSLPSRPSPSPSSTQDPTSQPRGKENQLPESLGEGPPSSPELPCLNQLLQELQCQLILPHAFPRRNLVQEARDTIVSTLQACHGCVPDLTLVLRGCHPCLPGIKPRDPEKRKITPSWINSPEKIPGQGQQRRQQGAKESSFTLAPPTSSTPIAHRASLAPPGGPWSPPVPSLPSPSGEACGPPTAFDLLKSIWLAPTPPAPRPWGIGPSQTLPSPPSLYLPRSSALDWSPSPPAPLPSLSWVVAQSSPESWSFPPMRLY